MISLSEAIIRGHLKQVEHMLHLGVPINVIDEYGFTPLIQTSIVNNADMAKLLLQHGADPLQHDLTGGTALHWAVDNNNKVLCKLLLEHGADVNAYTAAGEPVGVKAILRNQFGLQDLLNQYGMNIDFIEDYINAKLLGHRFELRGYVDIVNAKGYFVEIDLEGFFLEFTLDVIYQSLSDFQNNFVSKHFGAYMPLVKKLLQVFAISRRLIKYEHYQINISDWQSQIDLLLKNPILLLPISYEGHAITLIKCGHLLGKCDRSRNEDFKENVMIYKMNQPAYFNSSFIKDLMYSRQSKAFIDHELPALFALQNELEIPLGGQITGNCSWANVEASIPVILFFSALITDMSSVLSQRNRVNALNLPPDAYPLHSSSTKPVVSELDHFSKFAVFFYQHWREWDKDRALLKVIKQFPAANPARKASIAALLAAVLFQRCSADHDADIQRAQKIIPILRTPGYEYILESYIEIYCHQNQTASGKNLQRLINIVDRY